MKLSFTCVAGLLLTSVSAGGVRGAYEKTMEFLAYVVEDELNIQPRTIAPGCAAMFGGGKRCSLGQFLFYTWAPDPVKPNSESKPSLASPPDLGEKLDGSLKKANILMNLIFKAGLDGEFTNGIDPAKTLPGQTGYYEMIKAFGTKLNELKAAAGASPTALVSRCLGFAVDAAGDAMNKRVAEAERLKIKALNGWLKQQKVLLADKITQAKVSEMTTGKSADEPAYRKLDMPTTAAALHGLPNYDEGAMLTFLHGEDSTQAAINHAKAIDSIGECVTRAKC